MALDARRLRARDLAMSRRAPTRYAVAASALPIKHADGDEAAAVDHSWKGRGF